MTAGASHVAPLLVGVPFLTAALLAGFGAWLHKRVMDAVSLLVALAVLASACWLAVQTIDGPASHWTAGWVVADRSALGIRLLIEPLGAGMIALAGLQTAATFVFSWRYFEEVGHMYHALMLVLLGGAAGLCMAGDLFDLFIFLEVLSVCAYALTAYKVEAPALVGAFNFALTNTIGGVFVLIGIALVYARTGLLDMTLAGAAMGVADATVATALALVIVGFLVKSAMAPFHFWLPDTYAAAPTPVAVLFGGVLLEIGLFAAARIYWLLFAGAGLTVGLRLVLLTGGGVTAVVASVMAALQRNIKRMLAFVTVAHVALFAIGVGLLRGRALGGTAIAVLSHGPLMAALFLCAGILRQRHKTVDELRLFGRARDLPVVGAVVAFAALVLAAPPFTGMDAGVAVIEEEAHALGLWWVPWAFVFVAAVSSGAVLRAAGRAFLGLGAPAGVERSGPGAEDSSSDEDTRGPASGHPWVMLLPAAVLALVGAVIPLLPSVRQGALIAASHLAASGDTALAPLHVSWTSIAGPLGALLFATLLLARHRAPAAARAAGTLFRPVVFILQGAHTPHAGDHIGWLVLGAGLIALVLNLAVR